MSSSAAETFVYALLGGFFFGLYPSQIKTAVVLKAKPSPIVFQIYKTAVVFFTGFLFLLPRLLMEQLPEDESAFVFSWWGFISALFWIPAGLTTIKAVPLIGMGMVTAVSSATNAILSFTISTSIGINRMKPHSCGFGCTYYLAPIWLITTVIGIYVMVFPGKLLACVRRSCWNKEKCDLDFTYDPLDISVELGNRADSKSLTIDGARDKYRNKLQYSIEDMAP